MALSMNAVRRLTPAAMLIAAGACLLGADSRASASRPAPALYCSGCLCEEAPPAMAVPGAWVANGAMLAGHRVHRFVPHGASARIASSCRPLPRG